MILLYCDDFPSSYADKPGQHTLAWALAYMALGMLTGEEQESFRDRITYLEGGKPYISEKLWVNVSHSPSCVAAASDSAPVGVDCERRFDWKENLARRVCTPFERELLERAEASERQSLLNRIWSRKESLLKRSGEGIRKDLRKVETMRAEEQQYTFWEMQTEQFTVCTCGAQVPGRVLRVPFSEICEQLFYDA